MKMSRMLCLLALAGAPASAHHSFAMFDRTKTVVLRGTVKEFQWTNPHSWVELMVKDASGNLVEWGGGMGAPGELLRQGWRPHSLVAGEEVVMTINPMKDGSHAGSLVSVTKPGGTKIP
jgi:hypothetical protein